jgi:hypothetical protein
MARVVSDHQPWIQGFSGVDTASKTPKMMRAINRVTTKRRAVNQPGKQG